MMKRFLAPLSFLLIITFLFAGILPVQAQSDSISGRANTPVPTATATPKPPYLLTILHTNDIHANHLPANINYGGDARAASVIKQVRAEKGINTLLLNAGDNFTGTLFYVQHRGKDSADLMNAEGYDAMTLGNHEFDEGDARTASFIKLLRFPVVAANLDVSKSTVLKGKIKPYVVVTKGGEKIGIIGLVNPDTPTLARPSQDLKFDADLVTVTQKYVDEITAKGINKIVLITHLGFSKDSELAAQLKGVDIIVGGHSHTLLANQYSGADGEYPKELKNADGKPVLVVQAGEKLEYLSRLDVSFDENGDLIQWSGDAIQLGRYITPDVQVNALIARLNAPIANLTKTKVGESSVLLVGERTVCRFQECNMGNLITDAMRKESGAQIAIENGGGIRASVAAGNITLGNVLSVLPFGNLMSTLKLKGMDVKAALENGVSKVDSEEGTGRFPQVSGVRFSFDKSLPAGSRITQIEVMDAEGKYQPLDLTATYSIATNDFMRGGGDGYSVFVEKAIDPYDYGRPLDQVLADYIKANSPIKTEVEGRINSAK